MPCVFKVSPPVGNDELNALFASAWPDHPSTDFQPLLRHALFYVCAYEDSRLIGFAKIVSDGALHGFLLDPIVAPDQQRKGIGRQLVERCAAEARNRGVEWLHVDFAPHLKEFYAACGFSPTEAGLMNLKRLS